MEWLRQQYRSRMLQDVGSTRGVVNRINRVPIFQSMFQQPDRLPVHLKGPRDRLIYNALMVVSVIGVGLTFMQLARMSTGQLRKV
ncbi:cytochrome c oxidase subunit 7A2, mitochondrial-like [Corticium candelabrum]|uniref:cytochrome c oxidase subunit 7A2, mitochondrial-like n=1 Tax=Corticium candelabrum TaxID=121492 RepID=UPI002E2754B8|nr:cytochrome c oxidase subunit 7A2, mitochondrial-like [Corticium candelabrum]